MQKYKGFDYQKTEKGWELFKFGIPVKTFASEKLLKQEIDKLSPDPFKPKPKTETKPHVTINEDKSAHDKMVMYAVIGSTFRNLKKG